jgi:hypothetical protein
MKLPSLSYLALAAGQSFIRFPLSIICAAAGVVVGIYLNENQDMANMLPWFNLLLCLGLGISLFFCVDVFAYSKGLTALKKLFLTGAALAVLVIIYFTLPGVESTHSTSVPYIRYSIYSITIHLMVAFIPFVDTEKINGFWHYNKMLFIRILTSGLYSLVLYGGLALALGSLDFLFDIDLHNELFLDLFIVIAGLFNTWFFISGIPSNFSDLEEVNDYPKGIKIFSQYVLLSLLVIYLIILYTYAGKIVVLWNWPKGIVSYLIACVAVLGILTLLLMYPYGNLPGNAWIKKISRAYYFVLFPLVILLFVAIGMRIEDYGITINRYIILSLGVWLTIVCIYFAIGKRNIKFIPISLAIILIVVSFGYWGMFSVSERSQVKRLRAILEDGKILQDGKIKNERTWFTDSLPTLYSVDDTYANENVLSDSLHNEVKSILDYLDDHHGFSLIKDWYHQDIDSLVTINSNNKTRWTREEEPAVYMRSMGLEYTHKYKNANYSYYNFSIDENQSNILTIRDYDYLLEFVLGNHSLESDTFKINNVSYALSYPLFVTDDIKLRYGGDSLIFNMHSFIKALLKKHDQDGSEELPIDSMSVTASNSMIGAKLLFKDISLQERNDTLRYSYVTGKLFLKITK